jgi:hypothetical protein
MTSLLPLNSLELNHIDILMRISCNLHEDVFHFGKLRKIAHILNTVVISDGKEVDIAGINKRTI